MCSKVSTSCLVKIRLFCANVVCCSVLQCVAVCWSVLQCVAVCCSALQLQPIADRVAQIIETKKFKRYVWWLIHMCDDSIICVMTHSYVWWLIDMCDELFCEREYRALTYNRFCGAATMSRILKNISFECKRDLLTNKRELFTRKRELFTRKRDLFTHKKGLSKCNLPMWNGVATISKILKNVGLQCKRALQNRPILCKRPFFSRILLIVATPFHIGRLCLHKFFLCVNRSLLCVNRSLLCVNRSPLWIGLWCVWIEYRALLHNLTNPSWLLKRINLLHPLSYREAPAPKDYCS